MRLFSSCVCLSSKYDFIQLNFISNIGPKIPVEMLRKVKFFQQLLINSRLQLRAMSSNNPSDPTNPEEPKLILVEKSDQVTLIGINRPEVRNAIDDRTAKQLSRAIHDFEEDQTSPVAILHGLGGTFCAGYDLNELTMPDASPETFILRPEGAMGPTRRHIKKPMIAAIQGYCVAGGMELALLCDLRIVEDTAVMGFFNRRFGVPLVDGGTVRLPALIGLSRALDLILTGRHLDAREALEMGLANRVVAPGTGLGQSIQLANQIAKFPQLCLNHDRDCAYYAAYEANSLRQALQQEVVSCSKELLDVSKFGAQRFKEGVGRGGKFHDIKDKNVADWEKDEIRREEERKRQKEEEQKPKL